MSTLSELVEKMEGCVTALKSEVAEFEGGKKASASKVRKVAQDGKNILQSVRIETMNVLKSMPTKTRAPKTDAPAS